MIHVDTLCMCLCCLNVDKKKNSKPTSNHVMSCHVNTMPCHAMQWIRCLFVLVVQLTRYDLETVMHVGNLEA
jgi:hypothetical protein